MPNSKIGQDELSQACWTAAPVTVAYTGTAARSAQLTGGKFYYVMSTTDCNFLQGSVTVDATTSSNFLPAKTPVLVRVTDATANGYVSFITATGSSNGTAYLMSTTTP